MTDIDWLAVDMVVSGVVLKLKTAEKRAVVRMLAHRILDVSDPNHYTGKVSCSEVARRLQTTERSVERYKAELAGGTRSKCPVCGQMMWTVRGTVLPHADSLFTECPMTGQEHGLRGLAAERPDLYPWVAAMDGVSA